MDSKKLRDPDALVSTSWLEAHLDDPGIRIFDCSTVLAKDEEGRRPYIVESCREEHDAGHIPGAGYLDLQADFSREDSPYGMTLANPAHVAAAFARSGVDNGLRIVLYSRRSVSWSTRFWWMLKWLGFDNASIVDGGFDKWEAEGRPMSRDPCRYPPGTLSINPKPSIFVGRDEVLAALDDPTTCIVNALGSELHVGKIVRYGRAGRIPGSVNVPQKALLEPNGVFRSPDEIVHIFAKVEINKADNFITYCGGGIFATVDAFWLHQLGYENVAVYDNSMSEWGADSSLPIECEKAPN